MFAPNNNAFAALPAGTVDSLLEPQNKPMLTSVLTYHVVPGAMTTGDLKAKIAQMGGSYSVKTVNGEDLTFKADARRRLVVDMKGDIGAGDDPGRDAVERRHPRHRHGADAVGPAGGRTGDPD